MCTSGEGIRVKIQQLASCLHFMHEKEVSDALVGRKIHAPKAEVSVACTKTKVQLALGRETLAVETTT